MIEAKDIAVTTEPDPVLPNHTQVRAGMRLTNVRVLAPEQLELLEREKSHCRAEIWDGIYGDVARKIEDTRRNVLCSTGIHGDFEGVQAAFNELAALVRNPF